MRTHFRRARIGRRLYQAVLLEAHRVGVLPTLLRPSLGSQRLISTTTWDSRLGPHKSPKAPLIRYARALRANGARADSRSGAPDSGLRSK